MQIYFSCFLSSMLLMIEEKSILSTLSNHLSQANVIQLCHHWWKHALIKLYMFPSLTPFSASDDHLYLVPTSTTSNWYWALIVKTGYSVQLIIAYCNRVRGTRSCKWTGFIAQQSPKNQALYTGNRFSTQHDARERSPALIVLKEENNNKHPHFTHIHANLSLIVFPDSNY